MGRPKKSHREKDLTGRYMSGGLDEDQVGGKLRFSDRAAQARQSKIVRTAAMRAEDQVDIDDLESLPVGQVVQVYSLFSAVRHGNTVYLCVVRKTMAKLSDTGIVTGDLVRFRPAPLPPDVPRPPAKPGDSSPGQPEGVIEAVLPRRTILTRADSFKGTGQHPIVANAQQMLIVASLLQPGVKWGLIDRMIIAAQSGKLLPIVCLNKIDLGIADSEDVTFATAALAHYESLGVATLQTSVENHLGIDELHTLLHGHETVLAGHSGVGKSSLIRAIQPKLDIRIGEISHFNDKGRHTTTSARRYELDFGGTVIDTPGVKLFGLWNVSPDNLLDFFPDVAADTAPPWRRESCERIMRSLRS